MLTDARTGRVNAIIAWAADRLTRRPVENEEIIDLAERLGVKLATVTGDYDLGTPSGRLHFRQLGIIARYESEHRAERLRLKHEELARQGKNASDVRGYRKRSPGGRPLVGCSHRHHARRTCRVSRWRSCSRT
jgi:DNA invertase Pin-like site-specific DNA recombinase